LRLARPRLPRRRRRLADPQAQAPFESRAAQAQAPRPEARMIAYVALTLGSLAFALWLGWAIRKRALHRRPILLAFAILAWLPALYAGLVFAELVPDHRLRFERPLLTCVGAVVLP